MLAKKENIDSEIQSASEKQLLGEISSSEYDCLLSKLNEENNQIEKQINDYKIDKMKPKPLSKNLRVFIDKIKRIKIDYSNEDLSLFKELIEQIKVKKISRNERTIKIKYKIQLPNCYCD